MKLLGRSRSGCANCLGQKTRTPIHQLCGGKGVVRDPRGSAYPVLKCKPCRGKGRIKVPCNRCGGTGKEPT